MRRLLAVITTLLIVFGAAAPVCHADSASEISADDAIEIHATVQSQLDALANDDAVSAFQLTTAAKRMQIGTPDNFLRMIKEDYGPIYRHLVVIFFEPQVIDGDAVQVVRVTGSDSHVWVAVFWMQQEEDSSWKIDGCQLIETTSVST